MDEKKDADKYLINFKKIKITNKFFNAFSASFLHWLVWSFVIFVLLISSFNYLVSNFWGNETIGSPQQKKNYSVLYWVYLQPNYKEAKTYRVAGEIEHSPDNGDMEYVLQAVKWTNGGISNFTDCDMTIAVNYSDSYTDCKTDDGDAYTIRLGEKVNLDDPYGTESRKTIEKLSK